MRSSNEIKKYAESLGMEVKIWDRGTSYRAGGDIICIAHDVDWKNEPVSIKHQPNAGFDGTGYDGRGRHYDLWLVNRKKEGEKAWISCTRGAYLAAEDEHRLCVGLSEETRSGSLGEFFLEEGYDSKSDLAELFAGWHE